MKELNEHIVCFLCAGYFIDATTITECLHTCEWGREGRKPDIRCCSRPGPRGASTPALWGRRPQSFCDRPLPGAPLPREARPSGSGSSSPRGCPQLLPPSLIHRLIQGLSDTRACSPDASPLPHLSAEHAQRKERGAPLCHHGHPPAACCCSSSAPLCCPQDSALGPTRQCGGGSSRFLPWHLFHSATAAMLDGATHIPGVL